jgi:tripartite-type tricarboxylate transporter receptor subunit TctC
MKTSPLAIATIAGLALFAGATLAQTKTDQQNYPVRPVRVVVAFAAGSATDSVARVFGRKLGDLLGQPFVVENRAGANGVIGSDFVAKAAPDGYTLLVGTNGPNAVIRTIMKNVPYDPFRDFTPVSLLGVLPQVVLVAAGSPHRTLAELIAYARANPGKLAFASSNAVQRVSAEMLASMSGAQLFNVSYKNSPQAMTDLTAGEIGLYIADMIIAIPQVKAGNVRPLAVTTIARASALPEVASVAEQGFPGYQLTGIFAMFGPAGLPADITARLNAAVRKAAADPDLRTPLAALGLEIETSTPEALTARFRDEATRWQKVTRDAGIQPE